MYIHASTKQSDLQSDHRFSEPNHGKNTAEHCILLLRAGREAEEKTEQETKDQRAPEIPVAQAGAQRAAQQRLGVHDAARQAGELLARARDAGAAEIRVGAAEATLAVKHGAAQEVARVQHLAQLGPDGQQVAAHRLPDGLVNGVL